MNKVCCASVVAVFVFGGLLTGCATTGSVGADANESSTESPRLVETATSSPQTLPESPPPETEVPPTRPENPLRGTANDSVPFGHDNLPVPGNVWNASVSLLTVPEPRASESALLVPDPPADAPALAATTGSEEPSEPTKDVRVNAQVVAPVEQPIASTTTASDAVANSPTAKSPTENNPRPADDVVSPMTVPEQVATGPAQKLITEPRLTESTRDSQRGQTNHVVSVRLPPGGWIYVGAEGPGEVEYLRKEYGDDEVAFFFSIGAPGSYELSFDGQRLETGAHWTHLLDLQVDNPQPDEAVAEVAPVPDSETYRRVGGDVNRALGSETGVPENADRAAMTPEELRTSAETRRSEGDFDGERLLLEELHKQGSSDYSWVLYRLAQIYEMDEFRDLRKARELYARVVAEYPFSNWWEPSRRRIAYLDRHFFLIR